MEIKPGYWRTRDGRKARVLCTDAPTGTSYAVVGYVEDMGFHRVAIPAKWSLWDGHAYKYSDGIVQGPDDLVAPWVDAPVVDWDALPKWANWVAKEPDGAWWWYDNRPHISTTHWVAVTCAPKSLEESSGPIPDSHAPTFDGDWKDSLVERPKGEERSTQCMCPVQRNWTPLCPVHGSSGGG